MIRVTVVYGGAGWRFSVQFITSDFYVNIYGISKKSFWRTKWAFI